MMVPGVGIEPTLPCGNEILSLARLPVSPPGLEVAQYRRSDICGNRLQAFREIFSILFATLSN